MKPTLDWNVVATIYGHEFDQACRLLSPYGELHGTEYYNVVVLRVEDVVDFLESIEAYVRSDASIPNCVSRIVPVTRKFVFESPEEFERKAREAVEEWVPELLGKRFHVRMHRRGFKGRLSSQHEEQFLDHHLLERLEARGSAGRIDFDDPDAIIAVETLGQTAGLSCWTRGQLRRYEMLNLD